MSTSSVAVLSDAHLGDRDSLLELTIIQEAVARECGARSAGTLVLLGDTLDLNFGTLVTGIEGRFRHPERAGLRALLTALWERTSVREVVYVPGNHDFVVFDWEARLRNALSPLRNGEKLAGQARAEGSWCDSFLTGLLPAGSTAVLAMTYPHYVAEVGGSNIVLTHGHYLDWWQCGRMSLEEVNRVPADKRDGFLDMLFKASAQYQIVAQAIAVRRSSRVQAHRTYNVVTAPLDSLTSWLNSRSSLRHKPLSQKQVPAIEAYLHHVVRGITASAFIFGHTHAPGRRETPLPIYNSGSFVPPASYQASMLFLHPAQQGAEVEVVWFDAKGGTKGEPWGAIRPVS